MDSKWLIRAACAAAANAITIAIAASLFDRFEINAVPYVVAVVIFTVAVILIKPVVERLAGDYASGATWLAGVVATYIYDLVDDNLVALVGQRVGSTGRSAA